MDGGRVEIPKVWRSEISGVITYLLLCVGSIAVSHFVPGSVIHGELFSWGSSRVVLSLPLAWLAPLSVLFYLLFRMYNVRFTVDHRGVEAILGVLSLNQRIIRIRYEDIRSIETEQTLIERALDVGDVEIGTAATAEIELALCGVGAPREIQEMLQAERDKRQRAGHRSFQLQERQERASS